MSNAANILIVDDSLHELLVVRALLEKGGYQVKVADSPSEAQGTISNMGSQNFDFVLSDFLMPGMTGLELAEWIREKDPTLMCGIMSAFLDRAVLIERIKSRIGYLVEKPIAKMELYKIVEDGVAETRRIRGGLPKN